MRPLLALAALLFAATAGAADLTMDDLYGHWGVDPAAKTPAAVAAAEDSLVFLPKLCRARFGERMVVGMWRVEQATATTATVLVFDHGDEQRLALRRDGTRLFVDARPDVPFVRAAR